jgi:hypothetical protein
MRRDPHREWNAKLRLGVGIFVLALFFSFWLALIFAAVHFVVKWW